MIEILHENEITNTQQTNQTNIENNITEIGKKIEDFGCLPISLFPKINLSKEEKQTKTKVSNN